jgi:hypothetical protein
MNEVTLDGEVSGFSAYSFKVHYCCGTVKSVFPNLYLVLIHMTLNIQILMVNKFSEFMLLCGFTYVCLVCHFKHQIHRNHIIVRMSQNKYSDI